VLDGGDERLHSPRCEQRKVANAAQPVVGAQAHDDMGGAASFLVGHFDDEGLVGSDFGHEFVLRAVV
jgi:hypothetical protein